MCTVFNLRTAKPGKRKYSLTFLVLIILILVCLSGRGQAYSVAIAIAVTPAYTSRITDYTNQPNKIMATIINTSSTTKEIYILGNFSGEGGIRIYTNPTYKMPEPIVLQPYVPYIMTRNNVGDVFDANHLLFEGISKNQLLYGPGLPEGEYTLCLRAYDYNTNQPLSAEDPQGCSNSFTVTNVEPSEILQPVCGEEVMSTTPQAIIFSWTRPPGIPLNAQYNLKIIEVLPGTRNQDNAIQTANNPVFFSKDLLINTYLLGPLDPQLVPGNKYVVVVTVFDPAHIVNFRNFGMSASCSFNYVKDLSTDKKKE
ncbi:MAG: hypothetical protein D4R97_06235 [Bacteroidetes bacterium]|nr:MAG: hypothetical protein D4R97_06235 [Bacteroidota bacterium]